MFRMKHFVSISFNTQIRLAFRKPFSRLTMSTEKINLLRLVSASVHAAEAASKVVRDVMKGGNLAIVDKGINDLQTEADRSAQRVILSCLNQNFPSVRVIGEEDLPEQDKEEAAAQKAEAGFDGEVMKHECPDEWSQVEANRIVVWVDPLDGTSEYTQGYLDHVTVLIGIAVDGKSVAGVICQPFANYKNDSQTIGRTIWAIVGLGAFGIVQTQPPSDRFVVITTRSHPNQELLDSIKALEPCEVLRVGGAGHKVLNVIEGKAHVYLFPSPGCKKWDTCAPEAVLRANGGFLTDIHGNDIKYSKDVTFPNESGVLATTNREVLDKCLRLIPPEVKYNLIPKHSL